MPDLNPDSVRPFREIRDAGLLWLINTTVFHPRGYALALAFDADGNATGWKLLGDGTEPWVMPDHECDEQFAAASQLLTFRAAGDD